ncbi:ABC transporter substrate-binding protein [Chloroflexota bacterium]
MRNKKVFWLLALVVILSLGLAACGPQATPEPTEVPTEVPTEEAAEEEAAEEEAAEEEAAEEEAAEEEVMAPALRIGLVTDVGEVDDKSFNQSAWEGVQAAAEMTGGEAQYIETQDTTDYATNIAEFADNEFDIIVTVGFALGEATIEAAGEYPDIHFIGVDQFQGEALSNVTGLVFNEDQAGYLAGVLAANLTESDKIAGVYGTDLVPPVVLFGRGFEAGALATNPDIEVITTYHPGGMDVAFTDPEWGATTAAQAIDQGVDVIFSAGGKTGNGGLGEVANRTSEDSQLFCIGVDTDQWETLPEAHACLVSSAVKLIPVGVEAIVNEIVADNAPSGNYFGPVGLADFHDFADVVPEDVQAELEEIAAALTAGELETGVTLGGGEEEAAEEEAEEEAVEEEEEAAEEEAEEETMAGTLVTVAPDDPLMLGFAAALSGEGLEPLGVDEQRGAELALADRPTVTIDGVEFTVALDVQDALCSGEGGQTVANRFASDESIAAVVGHMCSSSCTAATGVYEEAGLTMVSPSCTAPNLTADGLLAFNRVVSTDAVQGPVAADFILNTVGATKIATIHDGSPYGEGLVTVTGAAFEELGGEVVSAQAINVGETDFRAVLEDIAASDPELIYFAGFVAEGARIAEQRADVGLEDVPYMGADGINAPEFVDLAGDAAEGVIASAPVPVSSDVFDAFLEVYEEVYDEAPIAPFHAHAYDAVGVILDAIEVVGVLDDDGNLVIDRAALAAAIRGTTDYQGLTGVLTCDENGECGGAVIDIYIVEDGEWVSQGVAGGEMMEEAEEEEEAMVEGTLVTVAPDDPLMLGFAAALSGEGLEPLGVDEQRGAELALADRPTVTVDGVEFTIALDVQDALCSGEGGQTVANRFASDESIAAVVGHMCSSSCTAATGVYEEAGLTMVSPSCTAPNLTADGLLAFNRVVSTDAVQGPVAADFILNTVGATKIATIHDGSPYGEGLVTVTGAAFEELGGEVVSAQAINVGETDFRAVLEDIAASDPELIYFAGFVAEGARIAEQRADVGLEDVPYMGADGINAPEFVDLAGDAAEGVIASAPVPVSSDVFDAFLEVYEEVYDEAPIAPFHAHAYDAVGVILDAIEVVGVLDDDGNLVIDRAALAAAIRGTADYQGLTGVLTCDENGECGGAVIDIYIVEDGAWVSQEVAE